MAISEDLRKVTHSETYSMAEVWLHECTVAP